MLFTVSKSIFYQTIAVLALITILNNWCTGWKVGGPFCNHYAFSVYHPCGDRTGGWKVHLKTHSASVSFYTKGSLYDLLDEYLCQTEFCHDGRPSHYLIQCGNGCLNGGWQCDSCRQKGDIEHEDGARDWAKKAGYKLFCKKEENIENDFDVTCDNIENLGPHEKSYSLAPYYPN